MCGEWQSTFSLSNRFYLKPFDSMNLFIFSQFFKEKYQIFDEIKKIGCKNLIFIWFSCHFHITSIFSNRHKFAVARYTQIRRMCMWRRLNFRNSNRYFEFISKLLDSNFDFDISQCNRLYWSKLQLVFLLLPQLAYFVGF